MATQAYHDWVRDGRPFQLALPVRQYRDRLVAAGWALTTIGTIGDEAHLQAPRPEDHTPFSVTGWPNHSPYPIVHAIDVSGPGAAGMSTPAVAAGWIEAARLGRTPWVKYIVWQAKRYDVRNDWRPVESSGHYDHVHVSFRTDYTHSSIGEWNPLTGKANGMSEVLSREDALHIIYRLESIAHLVTPYQGSDNVGDPVPFVEWALNLEDAVSALLARPPLQMTPEAISALAAHLGNHQSFIDGVAAAVAARVGALPTAEAVAREVARITWHGEVG